MIPRVPGDRRLTGLSIGHKLTIPGPAGPARVNPVRTVKVAAVSV